MIRSLTRLEARNRRLRMLLALPAAAAAAAVVAACSSSGTPSGAPSSSSGGGSSAHVVAAAGSLKTAKIGGATVLTNVKGFAVYSFAPDTMTKSDCTGACAAAWPPVKGPPPPGWVSPASSARSSAPTARHRPPTTGTLSTPSSRTPARARTRATASTRSAGCGTRSPRRVQQRRRPSRPAVRPIITIPRRRTPQSRRHPRPRPRHLPSPRIPSRRATAATMTLTTTAAPVTATATSSRRPQHARDAAMVHAPVRGHRPGAAMTGDQ